MQQVIISMSHKIDLQNVNFWEKSFQQEVSKAKHKDIRIGRLPIKNPCEDVHLCKIKMIVKVNLFFKQLKSKILFYGNFNRKIKYKITTFVNIWQNIFFN